MNDDDPTPPPLSARELARSSRLSFLTRQLDRLDRIARGAEEVLKFGEAAKATEQATKVHEEIQRLRFELRGKRLRDQSIQRLRLEIERSQRKSERTGRETKNGRPSPMTAARLEEACRLIELGMPRSTAVRTVGLSMSVIYRTERDAQEEEERGEYGQARATMDALWASESRVEERATRAITDLFDPEYEPDSRVRLRAATTWLERRRKADWATRTETTGAGGGPVEVAEAPAAPTLDPDTIDRMDAGQLGDLIENRARAARERRLAASKGGPEGPGGSWGGGA